MCRKPAEQQWAAVEGFRHFDAARNQSTGSLQSSQSPPWRQLAVTKDTKQFRIEKQKENCITLKEMKRFRSASQWESLGQKWREEWNGKSWIAVHSAHLQEMSLVVCVCGNAAFFLSLWTHQPGLSFFHSEHNQLTARQNLMKARWKWCHLTQNSGSQLDGLREWRNWSDSQGQQLITVARRLLHKMAHMPIITASTDNVTPIEFSSFWLLLCLQNEIIDDRLKQCQPTGSN